MIENSPLEEIFDIAIDFEASPVCANVWKFKKRDNLILVRFAFDRDNL